MMTEFGVAYIQTQSISRPLLFHIGGQHLPARIPQVFGQGTGNCRALLSLVFL